MTNKKVNKANFDQIKPGMTRAEVEAILGPGDREGGLDVSEGSGVAGAVGVTTLSAPGSGRSSIEWFKWGDDSKNIRVGFQGDRVVKGKIEQKGL
jgi:hypothetical protein